MVHVLSRSALSCMLRYYCAQCGVEKAHKEQEKPRCTEVPGLFYVGFVAGRLSMLSTTLVCLVICLVICLVVGISDASSLTPARCGQSGQCEQVKVRLQGIGASQSKQALAMHLATVSQSLVKLCLQLTATIRAHNAQRYLAS